MSEQTSQGRGRRQSMVGRVVSDKMDRTVVVAVENTVMHDLYRRQLRKTTKFYAHDEENECRAGDRVRLVSSRPLSRLKRWRVAEILERSEE